MVEHELPKLETRVRFPSPALLLRGYMKIFYLVTKISFCLLFFVFLSGCATVRTMEDFGVSKPIVFKGKGIYHKVKKGESLWRIAKTYDVSLQDIISANNIPNAAQVEENQLIFIPGASAIKEIFLDNEKSQEEFIWPAKGRIVRYFDERNGVHVNKGIDIEPQEETVRAARTGIVVFADYLSGYGQTVVLDHQDGFYSVYAQNAKPLVKLGDRVLKGDPLFKLERIDEMAYLHFQIRKKTQEDNPLFYLP